MIKTVELLKGEYSNVLDKKQTFIIATDEQDQCYKDHPIKEGEFLAINEIGLDCAMYTGRCCLVRVECVAQRLVNTDVNRAVLVKVIGISLVWGSEDKVVAKSIGRGVKEALKAAEKRKEVEPEQIGIGCIELDNGDSVIVMKKNGSEILFTKKRIMKRDYPLGEWEKYQG